MFRAKQGRPKPMSAAVGQVIVRNISTDHHLFIRVAAAKRRQEEMV
jgi:hypothetical protein